MIETQNPANPIKVRVHADKTDPLRILNSRRRTSKIIEQQEVCVKTNTPFPGDSKKTKKKVLQGFDESNPYSGRVHNVLEEEFMEWQSWQVTCCKVHYRGPGGLP